MKPLRRKLVRDAGRRKGQLLGIAVTALLGAALFGATFDAYRNLQASYNRVFVELAMADFTITGARPALTDELAALDGVAAVEERLVAETALRADGRDVAARFVSFPSDGDAELNRLRVEAGRLPAGDEEVALEKHLAEALDLHPRSSVSIALGDGWRTVTVTGVVVSSEYLWPARSRQEILVPSDQWGVVFGPPELVGAAPAAALVEQVLVGYAADAERTGLDSALRAAARRNGAVDAFSREDQASNAALREDIDAFGELSLMFPMLFLGAAGMTVYVLLGRLVRSQRAEIGVLLALGLARRRVVGHYLGFGLLAVVAGVVPGALLGMALGGLMTEIYTATLGIPTRVIELRLETPVIAVLFGLLMGLAGSSVPAIRAARLTPAEAMRGPRVGSGGESLVERVIPRLRSLPGRWKLVIRGLGRSRARTLATIGGIVLSVMLVLTSWGMLDTIEVLLDRQFGRIERQSLEAISTRPIDERQLSAARSMAGVTAAEPVARLQVGLQSEADSYGTSLLGFIAGTKMHGFLAADGTSHELPSDGLLVGDALRERLDIDAGDEVTLTTTDGRQASATIAGFVHEPLGTLAYGGLDYLSGRLGSDYVAQRTTSIFVATSTVPPDTTTAQSLSDIDGVTAVIDSESVRRLVDQYMALFYVFVGVMFVLGAILAFALIFATISANVSERIVELATLRAAGMSAGQLGRVITAENLLLTALGVVPGLVVGYFAAAAFMGAFSSDLFSFDLEVRPLSLIAAAAAPFVAVTLSLVPALRAVSRIDLAAVVRERAT